MMSGSPAGRWSARPCNDYLSRGSSACRRSSRGSSTTSSRDPSMPGMRHAPGRNMQMAHLGHTHAQGTSTVNSIDAAAHKVNVSHGPISTIGLPAMTMDFAVAPSVDLQAVKPGTRVNFTVERDQRGMYV